jgi:hypothetical protein
MDAAETVLDAVHRLEALGYTDELHLEGTGFTCVACGACHEPGQLEITHTFRFEGPSDPSEEAIVLGVACPSCGVKGIIVSAYGPDADPALFDAIRAMTRG